jgi:hypothetical protein
MLKLIKNDNCDVIIFRNLYPLCSYHPGLIWYVFTRIRIFSNPGSRAKKDFRIRIRIKDFKFQPKNCVSKLWKIWYGMFIPDPDLDVLPIPDSGVKNAPDPESVSTTLIFTTFNYKWSYDDIIVNFNLGHTGIVFDQYRGRAGLVGTIRPSWKLLLTSQGHI